MRNFFLGPIPELFSASFSSYFQEIKKMSTPLTRHYFLHFQKIQKIISTKTQTWHSWRSLVGRSRPRLGSPGRVLAQTRFPSRAQNIKHGPKWVQNRRFGLKIGPCESYGRFGPVRTGPGPKKSKSMPQNRQEVKMGTSIDFSAREKVWVIC